MGHEGHLSSNPFPVFSVGGPCEQLWHGQGCPLFDAVHPEVPLPTMALPTLQGVLKDGFGEAVVACDMPTPYKFPSLEPLLATVKRRKLTRFGHVTRHDSLSKTILQDTLEGGRRRGRQRKCWMDNIKMWTSPAHARTAHYGLLQKRLEEDLCSIIPCVPPSLPHLDPVGQGIKLN